MPREIGDDEQEINWPTMSITDNAVDMLNRPETFYNDHQVNIVPSPSPPTRSRLIEPSYNQPSSLMSQNLRLSSSTKLRH